MHVFVSAQHAYTAGKIVHLVAGLILLAAAVLKYHQLLGDPSADGGVFGGRPAAALGAVAEAGLGAWLVSGLAPLTVRAVTVLAFASFFFVAARQTLLGRDSCGCFGVIKVVPWATAAFDLASASLIAFLRTPSSPSTGRGVRVIFVSLVLAAAATGAGVVVINSHPARLVASPDMIDLGVLGRGEAASSDFIVSNPSRLAIELGRIHATCPCLEVEFDESVVAPGRFVRGRATLDMARESDYSGSLSIEVTGVDADGGGVLRLRVNAVVTK